MPCKLRTNYRLGWQNTDRYISNQYIYLYQYRSIICEVFGNYIVTVQDAGTIWNATTSFLIAYK